MRAITPNFTQKRASPDQTTSSYPREVALMV